MADGYRLDWRGAQVRAQVVAAVTDGLAEFGLRHETEAKRELTPGRGVLTGTLRRSIHSAGVSYNFAGDDVTPTPGSPERGGQMAAIAESGGKVAVVTGSGMRYARTIEERYAYLKNSYTRVLPQLPAVLEKHGRLKGLT